MGVVVRDVEGIRYLFLQPDPLAEPDFANDIQTEMDLEDPKHPMYFYAQALISSVMFAPRVTSALVIGLGGGVIPKYLHHYFPECRITAVEIVQEVIDVAVSQFFVPNDDRCRLVCDDALEFVHKTKDTYDLIFMDAYGDSEDAFIEGMFSKKFVTRLVELTNPGGLVVFNLLFFQKELRQYLNHFFGHRSLYVTQMYQQNQIYIGFPHPLENPLKSTIDSRVAELVAMDPKLGYDKYWRGFIRCGRTSADGRLIIDPLGKK